MASTEAFLPLPTEDDPERNAAPQVPKYSPTQSGASTITGTSVEHLNVDMTGGDDSFPNAAGEHLQCCNCCCDFRRAVLIVNGISIVLKLLEMMGIALIATYVKKNIDDIERDMDDDENVKSLDSIVKGGLMGFFELIVEVIEFIAIVLYICGIYGALKFKEWGIITAGSVHAFQLMLGVLSMDIGNIGLMCLFLYPHYFFLKLMRAGIMTEYSYHKYANCCGERNM